MLLVELTTVDSQGSTILDETGVVGLSALQRRCMQRVFVVTFHNHRMPRFAESICSIWDTEEKANKEKAKVERQPLPPNLAKGARYYVRPWGVL